MVHLPGVKIACRAGWLYTIMYKTFAPFVPLGVKRWVIFSLTWRGKFAGFLTQNRTAFYSPLPKNNGVLLPFPRNWTAFYSPLDGVLLPFQLKNHGVLLPIEKFPSYMVFRRNIGFFFNYSFSSIPV